MSRLKIPPPPRAVVEDFHRIQREHAKKLAKDSGDDCAQLPPMTLNRAQRKRLAHSMRIEHQAHLRKQSREAKS